ncbi:MAG: hypothetical protein WBZ48_10160 [Bacteroidota bacterium]
MITKKMFDDAIQVIQEFGIQQGLPNDPDEEFWNILEQLSWGKRITDYKILKERLETSFPDKVLLLHRFIREKCDLLEDRLNGFAARYGTQRTYWGMDQNDFNEMVAHMIGLGKKRFYSVMQDPLLAKQIAMTRAFIPHFLCAFQQTQHV